MTFDELLDQLPPDVDDAISAVLRDYRAYMQSDDDGASEGEHLRNMIHYYSIISSILDNDDEEIWAKGVDVNQVDQRGYVLGRMLNFEHDPDEIMSQIREFITAVEMRNVRRISAREFRSITNQTRAKIGKVISYQFNESEIDKIQEIINDLRFNIINALVFEDKHRARILNRLEAIQTELHKKLSDLDRFWGLIGDAGVALGKFGKEAKPFVERIKELTQIVWKAQARAEQIEAASGPPLLERPSESNLP